MKSIEFAFRFPKKGETLTRYNAYTHNNGWLRGNRKP